MITLSSHTSCALQPLDVSCFKPFKTTFRKGKDNAIVRNNHCELNKIAFANWVEKALNTSFVRTPKLLNGFKCESKLKTMKE